jgi:cell division protein FtsQ
MIDERIAERRRGVREEHRRVRLRRTVWVVVVIVVAIALVVLERSALVGLEEIRVRGVERLEADEVRRATGLDLGTSTLRLRLARVEERVERMPAIRDADARRLDPLTVVVEVVEREPSLVAQAGGQSVVIDREGVVLDEGDAPGVPHVRLRGDLPAPGETVEEDPGLHNAFLAWRGLTGPLRSEVERYHAAGPNDLVLRLESGIRVRFGRADRIDEKVRALGVILEDIGDAEVREIDVRPPSAPVVVP